MSLSNFYLNRPSSSQTVLTEPLQTNKSGGVIPQSLESAPLILRQLGNRLDRYASSLNSSQKIQTTSVKRLEESHGELEGVLNRINHLMQIHYQEESSNVSYEIMWLAGKVKELEVQVQQLNQEGELSTPETNKFLNITNSFHNVLSSIEDWFRFQERYVTIDEQLCGSLETLQPSVYSDLHGWSPAAFDGMIDSVIHMMTLIEMSDPILEQNSLFKQELVKQLSEDIHAASWGCSDWFHEVLTHFNDVLAVAEKQWALVNQKLVESGDHPSLEVYSELLIAAEQLLSMKQVLEEMKEKLPKFPSFKSMAEEIGKEIDEMPVGSDERANKKRMKRDFEALGDMVDRAKIEVPNHLGLIEGVIQNHSIVEGIVKASEKLGKMDLKPPIEKIFQEYKESEGTDLDRYVNAKAQLKGILFLPNSKRLYPDAHAFCASEEQRLIKKEQSPIDFDELVRAQMMKKGQPQPGLFSRIWQAVNPANWSERTKYLTLVSGLGLMAIKQISEMGPKSQPTDQKENVPVLTPKQTEDLDLETSYLGNILNEKFDVMRNDRKWITPLSHRAPEIEPVLRLLVESYSSAPDPQKVMDGYRAYREEMLLTGKSNLDWVTKLTPTTPTFQAKPIQGILTDRQAATSLVKTEATSLPLIEGGGSFFVPNTTVSLGIAKQEVINELKTVVQTVNQLDRKLRECSRSEFLRPKQPTSPKALISLREEIALFRESLSDVMINQPSTKSPVPDWILWNQSVQKQCHDLNKLERRIAEAMSMYEEGVAMQDYQAFSVLDVYGNKHKNLIKQGFIVEALGLPGVVIPAPEAISSQQVLRFLKEYAPEIFEEWEQIKNIYSSHPENILENEEVVSRLKAVEAGIQKAFAMAANDKTAFESLGISPKFLAWLNQLEDAGAYIMVRSTGAEDSKQSANAGGNVSKAYVKPTQNELCEAFGDVVKSYFGIGSLQKRLNANVNPFGEELRAAVTAQELIGEEIGGAKDPSQIPVSLVLFTSEPLYIGEEKFRAMRLSATYGHGEGVVGNQGIASDTATILISASDPSKLYILYDNQEKPERLAPVRGSDGKVTLQKIANSAEMAKRPALDNDLLTRLYEWGIIGEKFFEDYPTDMELVVKGGTIYSVQARPVNRPKLVASYVDLKKISELSASPIEKTLKAGMIVPGKGAAVVVTKPDEILMADTLEIAEKQFIKGQHKLVVIGPEGRSEPVNSHPVVNFSALGMPCLYVNHLETIRNLVKEISPDRHLAACVQSATLSLWDNKKGTLNDYISEGFIVHPAKIAISVPFEGSVSKRIGIDTTVSETVPHLLTELRTATTSENALKHLKELQKDPWILSLQEKITDLKEKVAKQPLFGKMANPIIMAAEILQEKIQESFSQIENVINSDAGRLKLLLHVKILETYFFQKPTSPGAIAQFSILGLQDSFSALDALMLYQSQLPHQAHFADVLMDGSQSPVEEVFAEWNAFLLKLEPIAEKAFKGQEKDLSTSEIAQFKTVLHTLRQADVMPLFMTFFFNQKDANPITTVRNIIALMPSVEEPLIEQVFVMKKEVDQLRNDINQIGSPKAYNELLERLKKLTNDFSPSSQNWLKKEQWNAASPITRSIAIQTLNELVDLYDTAIKTMKASPEIKSDVEKTQKFKEMLGPYLKLLKDWSTMTVGNGGYIIHELWPLATYLAEIESIYKGLSDSDPDQLRPSSDFSVSAAVLGARTAFERHYPKTLEDVFTLIHQNLLASSAVLTNQLFTRGQIQNSLLPPVIKQALKEYVNVGAGSIGVPQQTGVSVDQTGITFYFNVPLRNHSGKFSLRFDRQTGTLSMESQFLGMARDRWNEGADRAAILNAAGIIPLQSKPKVTPQELTYTWDILDSDKLELAFDEYRKIAELSLTIVEQNDLITFARFIEERGNISDVAMFLTKESAKSGFGKEVATTCLVKMLQIPDEPATLFSLIMQSSIAQPLISVLQYQVNGEEFKKAFYLEKVVQNFPAENKAFLIRLLERCKNDSTLTQLLTNAADVDPYFEKFKDLWIERTAVIAFIASAIAGMIVRGKKRELLKHRINFPQDPLALKKLIELELHDWLFVHPEFKKFVPELLQLKASLKPNYTEYDMPIEKLKVEVEFPSGELASEELVKLSLKDWLIKYPQCKKYVKELQLLKALLQKGQPLTEQIENLKSILNFPEEELAAKRLVELELHEWQLEYPGFEDFLPELQQLKTLIKQYSWPWGYKSLK